MKKIDWNEISELGLLVEINEKIMHPLGLAIVRCNETGTSEGAFVSTNGPFTYNHDRIELPKFDESTVKEYLQNLNNIK
ncbi:MULTISPECIES: DUF7415 domain-containing protein [unclassified Pseudoalteromonas]|uniref:DUF7415 domain-containing protein n=1 Tax=unclassified Pseudoalteromonas TaxID=194690 RepID=UPI001F295381|nr:MULTISPECIES: hypothetical protein [unclassified Pseudoalteromonas]MCF2826905.1 hypothetical protein [Pseudoalteromonas sp. OF5H-5]MCF2830602.1 hypothetical protein [Pseudoalteromonas sp. DL2-H6]MCF2923966.1 hypothetical protein [Pseudoalteromonas sp. DL2-H1]